MDIHAEQIAEFPLQDEDLKVFIRLGTDYSNNYYEYEIPLVLTPYGSYLKNSNSDRERVWPVENHLIST